MSTALRTALVRSALVATGAVAGAGGATVVSSGARESITLAVGDTVNPRFSVKTDSILAHVGTNTVVARRCGTSAFYLRVWRGTIQIAADTVTATVTCPAPVDTTPKDTTPPTISIDRIETCFIPPDSARKYGINGAMALDSAQLELVQPWCKHTDTIQVVPATPPSLSRRAS